MPQLTLPDDPDWYRDAVIYELHVRAFADGNGDGIGDFVGLTQRLDYLEDLGVTALWLLPFYPSPLRDDGYDIAEYADVHPAYGSLRDVKRFLNEAHRRGLRVITELVVNHTSDQHPWFQRARRAKPGSPARDFYVWSGTNQRYTDARIIFRDFETSNWTWDELAGAYYWHRFYSHQPDLNFDNPAVVRAVIKALEFWLDLGVDGLRLDAVPYLVEREGTNCENLPETHQILKQLRAHVDARYSSRMLLAEANQWPEDAVAYFGDGDECHMAFHFPVMPRLFMGLRMEDRFPIVDILMQTPAIPDGCQWATFLRNHDELTLEMVTDEERDYMYRTYATDPQARINLGIRRRLAPLLHNDRRRIELINGLLFSLPGTPVLYYGDEIGMGDNVYLGDRDSVRTPMQWNGDRNAGFSTANPQRLYLPPVTDPEYHYQTVNVAAQNGNPASLLRWMRQLIALRKRHPAFGRGDLRFRLPDDPRVLVFTRTHEDETVLVVANLSARARFVELDLAEFAGSVPVELFGQTPFHAVTDQPYPLTLGAHGFYWFALRHADVSAGPDTDIPTLTAADAAGLFAGRALADFEAALPRFLPTQRWFGAKSRQIRAVEVSDVVRVFSERDRYGVLALTTVDYVEGEPDLYQLPLVVVAGAEGDRLGVEQPRRLLARGRTADGQHHVIADAVGDGAFFTALLGAFGRRRPLPGLHGEVQLQPTSAFRALVQAADDLTPAPLGAEQSNSSVLFGHTLLMKLYRRVEAGENPDVEIGTFLTERAHFGNTPPLAGRLDYVRANDEPITVGVLSGYVPASGDHWAAALDVLSRGYGEAMSGDEPPGPVDRAERPIRIDLTDAATRTGQHAIVVMERVTTASEAAVPAGPAGAYAETAALLGRRTAELHVALAGQHDDPAFAPEPFTLLYQRSLAQSMRTQTRRTIVQLRRAIPALGGSTVPLAEALVAREQQLLGTLTWLSTKRLDACRLRHHGDYHLGQVLSTGRDVMIIDFEGEPRRSIGERRLKRSPLRDVAGMIRSFDYATHVALRSELERGVIPERPDVLARAEAWGRAWSDQCTAAFVDAYFATAGIDAFVPHDADDRRRLLELFTLEKAVYEVAYELDNRPAWVAIPLAAALRIVDDGGVDG